MFVVQTWFVRHVSLQSPQLIGSVAIESSNTQLSPFGSQSLYPSVQPHLHAPSWQLSPPVSRPVHLAPHRPQLLSFDVRSTHSPMPQPQRVSPGLQTQVPSWQNWRSLHRQPHQPQFVGSSCRARQVCVSPHAVRVGSVQPHTPLLHTPKTGSQSFPQAPQLSSSVERSTHTPAQLT